VLILLSITIYILYRYREEYQFNRFLDFFSKNKEIFGILSVFCGIILFFRVLLQIKWLFFLAASFFFLLFGIILCYKWVQRFIYPKLNPEIQMKVDYYIVKGIKNQEKLSFVALLVGILTIISIIVSWL
ncbi:hypothetical protein ACFL6D_04930, partial [Spirochaetota bacterium]